jgi:orotate phosphoribosyltransferase
MVLIVDDLITTGRTMRLSVEAIRAAGVAGFGFAFSGC